MKYRDEVTGVEADRFDVVAKMILEKKQQDGLCKDLCGLMLKGEGETHEKWLGSIDVLRYSEFVHGDCCNMWDEVVTGLVDRIEEVPD